MARKFIQVVWHPEDTGAVINGVTVHCVGCMIEYRRGDGTRRKYRRRAVVTAIDVTTGGRLPVAYCKHHVPDDMMAPTVGTGANICHVCKRPTRDHSLLESCAR